MHIRFKDVEKFIAIVKSNHIIRIRTMKLSVLLNLLLFLFSTTIADENVEWNPMELTRTVKPDVRSFNPQPNDNYIHEHYHYKTHFDIIIKKNTTFTLEMKSSKKIEELYFHCLTSSTKGTYNEISFKGKKSFGTFVTTIEDCVPITSVSLNIPVEVTIKTTNWVKLPIFDTRKVTFLTSEEAEETFYESLQIYGFVENYYTQMLISLNDVRALEKANFSLYLGSQNQADLIKYYDYLMGSSRHTNEDERSTYNLMERTTLFLRSEPCDPSFDNNLEYDKSRIIYDDCENLNAHCNSHMSCHYYAYYSSQWIAIITDISPFLHPTKGSEWVLLHEVGHNYNIAPFKAKIVGLGDTMEVWNNIFAALYQHKFNNLPEYWINSSIPEAEDTISNYLKGIPVNEWDWRPKLHFFMSLFGFDGTDSTFREFHIRYYQRSEAKYLHFNNIIPTLSEVFLDLHQVNILPYLLKVVNFKEYFIPLVNPDLELRLLSGDSVMPALDFNLKANDLQAASKERDFRNATPLILLSKVPKNYVTVEIRIDSPRLLLGRCLYLNNECFTIRSHRTKLQMLTGVYSSYIAVKIGTNLYVSEIEYHTIAENMIINVDVREVRKNDLFLPLVYYSFDAVGYSDSLFARIFINYKNNEIAISQFTDKIHGNFADEVYYSLALERDNETVFEYEFFGAPKNETQSFVNAVHEFEIGDKLHIYHRELQRPININEQLVGVDKSSTKNSYVFMPVGIHNVDDKKYEIIENDVVRIIDFINQYKIDLSYNVLFEHYLERYAHSLRNFDSRIEFPVKWLNNLGV